MEAHYRAFNGKLVIKVEGSTIKDLFEQIGPVAEVLDGDDCCGKCASPHIYPRAREAQGFTYYELVCSDCGAKLSFGQHKASSSLWAKRTDEHGNKLDFRGWRLYQALPPAPATATAPAPPPTTPRPAQSAPQPQVEPVRLERMIARCKSETPAQVLGELCSALEQYISDKEVDALWMRSTKTHGDPTTNAAAVQPVMIDLLKELERFEQKKQAIA